jgi:transcription initiation factor TFIIIB Brf1 subunit/transcription initiation factor TFIIB
MADKLSCKHCQCDEFNIMYEGDNKSHRIECAECGEIIMELKLPVIAL